MTRVNIIKSVLQIAEGWSVALPKAMHDQLDARTNSTAHHWFAPRLTGKGPFSDVYSVMANWGANHGVLTIGHVGADFITLAAMLRIPVCMHNVEEAKIYRPSAGPRTAWISRARTTAPARTTGRCISVNRLVSPGGAGLRPTDARSVGRISAAPSGNVVSGVTMKQDVILGPRLRRHERAGDGRGSTREHYRPRRNGERQRHRGGKSDWHQWSLEAIMQRFADCCRQIHDQLASCTVRGITVTTFGVDGALVDEGCPAVSDHQLEMPRTAAVMEKISQYMPARQLQRIAGVGAFAFNTLYKLVWLKENHPQLLAQAHARLFISSLINHRLTGSSPPTSPWRAPARCSISGSAISARRSCRRPACRAACSRGWLKQASRSAPCCRRRCAAGPPRRDPGYLGRA